MKDGDFPVRYVNVYQAGYTTMYTILMNVLQFSKESAPRQAEEDPPPQQQGHLEREMMKSWPEFQKQLLWLVIWNMFYFPQELG